MANRQDFLGPMMWLLNQIHQKPSPFTQETFEENVPEEQPDVTEEVAGQPSMDEYMRFLTATKTNSAIQILWYLDYDYLHLQYKMDVSSFHAMPHFRGK